MKNQVRSERPEEEYAIEVKNVVKVYKLYEKPSDRMKEALGLSKKKIHKELALGNVYARA